jgi:hypothetical protein
MVQQHTGPPSSRPCTASSSNQHQTTTSFTKYRTAQILGHSTYTIASCTITHLNWDFSYTFPSQASQEHQPGVPNWAMLSFTPRRLLTLCNIFVQRHPVYTLTTYLPTYLPTYLHGAQSFEAVIQLVKKFHCLLRNA